MTSRSRGGGPGPIEQFMLLEHVRIDRCLAACQRGSAVDVGAFVDLRHAVFRHMAMEERVLLPFARAKRGGEPLELEGLLRAEHRAIVELLVRRPTAAAMASLIELLGAHEQLEEGPSGLYAACDALAGLEAAGVVERLRALPRVVVAA